MSNKVGEWQLDDLNDALDTRLIYSEDTPPKVDKVECRDHWTLTRHRKLHASQDFKSVKGTMSADLEYNIGTYKKRKSVYIRFDGVETTSGDKYLCIQNGFTPEQPGTPGDWCIERQSWEFYSKWRDAPAAWNLKETA